MISLLRRDPLLRLTPIWLLVTPLIASAVEGARLNAALRAIRSGATADPRSQAALLALALWLPVALWAVFVAGSPRCNRLDLALPIPARRLWNAHLLAFLSAGLLVLTACAGFIELRRVGFGLLVHEQELPNLAIATVIGPVAALLFPFVVALGSLWPGRHRSPGSWWFRGATVGLAVLGYAAILALLARGPALLVLPLAGGGLLWAAIHRRVPAALSLAPRKPSARTVDAEAAVGAAGFRASRRPRTWWLVSRILLAGIAPGQLIEVPISWMFAPLLALWGVLLAGFPFGVENRIAFGFLAAYLMLSFWPAPLAQLGTLDPLPLSRRRLFALVTLPGFALLGLGYVGGRLLVLRGTGNGPLLPPTTPLLFAAIAILFLALASIYLRTFRAHLGPEHRKRVFFAILALLVVVQIGGLVLLILGLFNPFEATAAFEAALARLTARHVGVGLAVWLGSAALAWAAYALTERAFLRIEAPIESAPRES